jgi:integrase/recombinase XerC
MLVSKSLEESMQGYVRSVALARAANTARTYTNAMEIFKQSLKDRDLDPSQIPVSEARVDWITDFTDDMKAYAPATERLYLTAASGWYEFLAAEKLADVNLPRLRLLIRRRARRPGQRLPQFPREDIERVINYVESLPSTPSEDERQHLRKLRDRAFLLTLADTGMRVHEACSLRRGDLDWNEARALLIGKGDREDVIRFSQRAMGALKGYLAARTVLDGGFGRPLSSLPLFARHDRGAGSKVLPITPTTGRAIVHKRVRAALGANAEGSITPHSFRHYFVTTVLRGSGGNLKLAQELARHKNIAVTQRYAHLSDDELDRNYHEIFERTGA